MDEERRLAYVAMTRAIDRLYLSESEGINNDNTFKLPSRFIFDAGKENLNFVRELPSSFEARLNRKIAEQTQVRFNPGDRVAHPAFGAGTILEVDTKALSYRIRFDKLQTERAILFRAPLTKLESA